MAKPNSDYFGGRLSYYWPGMGWRMASCVICDSATGGSLDFCARCWNKYKDDIKGKKAWTKSLKNSAQRERRRKAKEYDNISLDSLIDMSYNKRRDY